MAALLGGWASMTIHALAGGPRSAAQVCEAIQVIDRGAVDARIDSMLETGLLEEAPGEDPDGEPLVRATEWLRRAVAPLAAAARMELRFPPGDTAPIAALDVEAAFQLTLPLLKLPGEFWGACSLAVELDEGVAGSPAGVTARVEQGRVVACERGLDPDAGTAVSGGAAAWLDAVIDRRTERISSSGERRLAKRILRELRRTLFKGVAALRVSPLRQPKAGRAPPRWRSRRSSVGVRRGACGARAFRVGLTPVGTEDEKSESDRGHRRGDEEGNVRARIDERDEHGGDRSKRRGGVRGLRVRTRRFICRIVAEQAAKDRR